MYKKVLTKVLTNAVLLAGLHASHALAAPADIPTCTAAHPLVILTGAQREFRIQLASNATTGFRWFLREYNSDFIHPISQAFVPPHQLKQIVGAPGEEIWQLRIVADEIDVPQQMFVHMAYTRPFEFSKAANTFVCQVSVVPGKG